MRADAVRNRDAVLDAGARLLAEHPTASMQEIADASGVGRTTVYRHFPAREDLVEALIARVADEVAGVTRDALAANGSADTALRRMTSDLVALGTRWRFLRSQRSEVQASVVESDRIFERWAAERQATGELRADQPATWLLAVTRNLVTAGIDAADDVGPDEAGRLAGETLVSALGPRP
jgi:AcrR family transcriptional regulator